MTEAQSRTRAPDDLLARLAEILGDKGLVTDPRDMAPHLVEPRGLYRGKALAIARPASTEEVAAVVALCAETGTPIVPQGGNTGLVGGGTPYEDGEALIVSLARMNRIRELDALNDTITVEAGCVLETIQEAASEADRLFPLSLGAQGSCQIGGNLSTNAGGHQVLRYGNTRELVLGLEVVLPDGRIWNGLRRLRKDNTGYDLKQLFIGAEGTLGIITAAVLRLFAKPRATATAFVAVRDPAAAVELLGELRAGAGETVTSFELIPRIGLDLALAHIAGVTDPLAEAHAWYALVELSAGAKGETPDAALEAVLAEAYESGLVRDAALAANEGQAADFWRIREAMVEAQKSAGGSIKHDVSVPVSAVPEFIRRASAAVEALVPGIRPIAFGHIGDGNVHFNLTQPENAETAAYLARWAEVNRVVHDIVAELDGSISAEHGIGRLKREENAHYKSPLEIELMQRIKQALDPQGIMNPGKVLPE